MIFLTSCTQCNDSSSSIITLQNEELGCETYVHETVCVQGTVTITPKVKSGPSMSFCMGNPFFENCPGELVDTCQFTVSQSICVQIPLTFFAKATAMANGIVCGMPETGHCPSPTTFCTYTIGFFRNHPEVTNSLITNAGGSILLGTGSGLSFVVTTTNANDVLTLNTDSPPAPENPPLAGQYQNLYAQLLAAKLNVLNLEALGAEICTFATNAIIAADGFLDASPEGGMDGAPDVQEPLELFNSGSAPGCPVHCNNNN